MNMVRRIVLMTLVLAAVLALAQESAVVFAQEKGGKSAAGVSATGASIDTSSAVQSDSDGADSAVPIGYQFSDAKLARLKAQAEQSLAKGVDITQGDSAADAPDAPPLSTNFQGFAYTGWFPPDPTMAAGPSDLVVAVNSSWRIFNKSGGSLFTTTLLDWFDNVLPGSGSGFKVFDPWVIYDKLSGRYIIIAAATRSSDQQSFVVISVSDNSSATGNWCNWATDFTLNGGTDTSYWGDYPKAGVNKDAVYLTANMFTWPGSFKYAKLRIISKSALYNTSCPGFGWYDFWNWSGANGKVFTWQPAITQDSSASEYLVDSKSSSSSKLTLWRVNNPLSGSPTLSQWTINVSSYSTPPDARQKGSSTRIDTGDARLLNAVVVGSRLWTTHTTGCTWSGDTETRSCVRWYQLNVSAHSVVQQRSYGASGLFYFYPAIYANSSQNAAIVFSRSGSNEYANTRYTGRKSSDPLNDLQGSANLKAGSKSYVQLDSIGRNRWGDYGGIGLDPSNNCFWMHHEFASTTTNRWGTWVGRTCFP